MSCSLNRKATSPILDRSCNSKGSFAYKNIFDMQEENSIQQPDKVHEAVWQFVTCDVQKSSLIHLENWFLLAIQTYDYDDEIARQSAVEIYLHLKGLIENLSVLEPKDVTPLTLAV